MLAAVLEAGASAHIEKFADERHEQRHRLMARNGTAQPRTALTSAERSK